MSTKKVSTPVVEPEVAEPTTPEATTQPEQSLFNPGSDETGTTIFRHVLNKQYSKQIIRKAINAFDLEKIRALKIEENKDNFYKEAREQILKLWHCSEVLNVHTELFSVLFTIDAGKILNEVESSFERKSEFTKWRSENFDTTKHLRFLQQAQQLTKMGDFADRYAAIGKNRLLQLDHLRKEAGLDSCYKLFERCPIPTDGIVLAKLPNNRIKELYNYETTSDPKGEKLKIHLDAFISLKRFHNEEINFVNFDQATIMASEKKRAIYVKEVKEIKKTLDQKEDKEQWFEDYLMDRMPSLSNHSSGSSEISLIKVMNDLVSFCVTSQKVCCNNKTRLYC